METNLDLETMIKELHSVIISSCKFCFKCPTCKTRQNCKSRLYYNNNKEHIKQNRLTWVDAEENAKKISVRKKVKYDCECGSYLSRGSKSQHEKTKKHIAYMNKTN
jgi:hypothetical protein